MRASAAERAIYDESPQCNATLPLNARTGISAGQARHAGAAAPWRARHESASRASCLSSREREVLHWLSLGKSGPEIAIILGISTCTVRIHIQSVKRKLSAVNIPHAVYIAFAVGILRRVTALAAEPE
jgi:DNA-binding CsgD family transcriptional regulator